MKIALYILITGFLICSLVWTAEVERKSLTIRYITWSILAIVLAFVLIFKRNDYSIIKSPLLVVFGIYLLYSIFSLFKAPNFGEWFFDISRIGLMIVTVFLLALFLEDISEFSKIFTIWLITLCVYGLWALVKGSRYEVLNMGNLNLWSQYLILLSPFCLAAKGRWKIVGIFAFTLVVCNIFMAVSRAAIVALFVSSVVTAAIFNRKALCCILTISFIIGIFIHFSNTTYIQKLTNSSSAHSRFAAWKQTLKMTWDKYMVGAGNWKVGILPYSSGFIEPQLKGEYGRIYMLEAHNGYIEVAAEKSIFGFMAYLGIFILGLFYSYRSKNPYVFMGILTYMVYVFFDDKQRAPILILLMILFALAIKGYHKPIEVSKLYIFTLPICMVVLVGLLCGYLIRFDMEKRYLISKTALQEGDYDTIIEELSYIPKIATLNKYTTPYVHCRGDAYRSKEMWKEAAMDFSQAYRENPYNVYVLLSLGEVTFYANKKEQSLKLYQKVLEIVPEHPIAVKNIKLIEDSL